MSRYELSWLTTHDELRAATAQWDVLWQLSDVHVPLARAEFVAQWIKRFAHRRVFRGLVVKDGSHFVAALPLTERPARLWKGGGITANSWATCGDLLLDGAANEAAALDLLAEGLNEVPWPLVCLTPVACQARRWRLLLEAAQRRALDAIVVASGRVGQVPIDGRWNDYRATWSGNHRRHLRKAMRRAKRQGELSLDLHTELLSADVEPLLRRGCQIEDRSWKGPAGSSILRTPGMFDWHLAQAQRMADFGHLQLTFLKHEGQAIAFEYGYRGKGTYFSHKVGYDPNYAAFSPGQLLRAMLLEEFFSRGDVRLVDFWGPLSDATAKFATEQYPVGKVLIAPKRRLSRALLSGYVTLRPYWQQVRSWLS